MHNHIVFWTENLIFLQIANLVTLQGEDQPSVRNVMTLKSCSPIVGVDVMPFDTEREVLLAWRVFLLYWHILYLNINPPNLIHSSPPCQIKLETWNFWDMLIEYMKSCIFCHTVWCFTVILTLLVVNAIKYDIMCLEFVHHESIWCYATVEWTIILYL